MRSTAVLFIALVCAASVQTQGLAPAPAPGLVLPSSVTNPPTQAPTVSSVGLTITPSGAKAAAPVQQAVAPTVQGVPPQAAPTTQPPTQSPTSGGAAISAPGTSGASPVRAPASSPPTQAPVSVPTTATPASSPPKAAPVPSSATPPVSSVPAVVTTSGVPQSGPAVAPSSSGYYNATVRASNATGTLSQTQATAFAQQLQSAIANNGQSVGVQVTGQNASPQSATTGRKLSQSSSLFVLDIDLTFGPCTAAQAQIIRAFLNGLECNLGGIVVIVVIVVQPVNVVININQQVTIVQPTGYAQLPANSTVAVQSIASAPGTGGNINSQNVAGGGIVTQQGVGNTQVVNVNSGNTVTNNIVNNNNTTINNSVNTVVQEIINPSTPGTPSTPSTTPTPSTSPSTPGTTPASTPATPATPGGASASVASTVVTNLTYITQAAPPNSVPPTPPSPPPSPPPSCGSTQPQCRIYTRDMLCCQNEGILTPFQGAQVEILCTHPVRFAITCLATSGPTNISASSVYNNDYGYNYNFRTNINWLGQTNGYLGKVTVDVEPARQNSARPECSLNLQTPCDYNGTLISTMPTVQSLDFSVIDFNSFYQSYVGFPPTNAIGQFSYSWKDSTYPGGCLEQPTLTIPGSFFLGAWPTQAGFAYPCNATATYGALKQTCPNAASQSVTGVTGILPN